MKEADHYKLCATGRVNGNGQKFAVVMRVSKEIVEIEGSTARFTDATLFASIKERIGQQLADLAKQPVPIQQMKVAEVMTFEQTVTAKDIASGDFEGFEVGDTSYTEEILFGSWPVEL